MGIFGNEYNLYITGFKDQESNPDTDDIFLLQMSYNGDLLAEETWGGDFMDSGEAVWCDNNEIYVSGIYAVDNQSNTDQLLIKWALNNLPKAQFEYTKNGLTVSFTFTGDIGDDPAEFQWNFGDGSPIANEMNPTHTYPAAGQYTVSLTVIDADGDRSEYSAIVEVSENADDTGNNDQTSSTSGGDNDSESDQNDVKGIDGYPVFMLLIGILPIALIAMRINKLRRER